MRDRARVLHFFGVPLNARMGKLGALESQVESLSAEELARFRQWFLNYDAAAWEQQIECDANAGKLDSLADRALQEHARGKTTPL